MATKRTPKKKSRKPKKSKRGSQVTTIAVHDEAERAAAEAAIRAVRETRPLLHAARDPKSSMEAYAKAYAGADAVTKAMLEALEDEEEEEPDVVVIDGVTWRCVLTSAETYQSLRGPVRKQRKLYRKERNGETRCFWEERRGVIGLYMPDLGRVVIEATAELPAERAEAILERATGQQLSASTMKRVTMSVGNELRDEERKFFNARIRGKAPPEYAVTVVVNVDALSFNIRGEGYKQATVGTISFLNSAGDRLSTIRLGEMPEENKPTIMERVEREVRAILKKRPDLKTEVVIDGALDLRTHLLRLFPNAVHVTDFYHVVEYIADALRKLFPGDIKLRDEHRARLCHILKHEHGGATTVMNWIRDTVWILGDKLKEDDRHDVEGDASYIEGQLPYLNYAAAANDNLDLGSGVVEAACKTLVTQRLKISGAKWSRPGARAILYLRSLSQSGRLDDALDFHHATRLKRAAA